MTVPLAIQEAITARHVLRITYRDRHGRETAREVEPVAFAATRAEWYLMAGCRLRGGALGLPGGPHPGRRRHGRGPRAPRSYRDLGVDIPDSIVRRPDLRVSLKKKKFFLKKSRREKVLVGNTDIGVSRTSSRLA